MNEITKEQVNEIVQQLDCGFNCYLHKATYALISLTENIYNFDAQFCKEEKVELKKNSDNYIEIEKSDSRQSFRIMKSFLDNLADNVPAKKYLPIAINNKKSFAGFNAIMYKEEELTEQWYARIKKNV